MLTKSEIDLLPNLRLSTPKSPSESDVTKQLDETIVELAANSDLNLDGDHVTLVVLKALAELLRRTTPKTAMFPMTEYDLCPRDFGHFVIDPDPNDPVGKTMGFDSVYNDSK